MRCKVCIKLITEENKSKFQGYHSRCLQSLFGSADVSPILTFDKKDFNSTIARNFSGKMSISGVQQKLSVKIESHHITPTDIGGAYILKPTPQEFEELSENEHLSIQIGKLLGVHSAECGLITFKNGENSYIVKRFDRLYGQKLHQEDLAQILGKERDEGGSYKYSGSYEEVGNAILEATGGKKVEVLRYLERLVYNFLICNGDYHLKNISLLNLGENGKYQELTPNYDSVNTKVYTEMEREFALSELFADGSDTTSYETLGFYTKHDFYALATKVNVPPTALEPFIVRVAKLRDQVIDLINGSFLAAELRAKYLSTVQDRLRALTDY